MNQLDIFTPMCALVLLTFLIMLLIPVRRFRAAFAKEVTPDDFALGESSRVPGHVALANRNYMNLLELPVLFYVLCLALFVTNEVTDTFEMMAWAYVIFRIAHSIVHVTYNNVYHRLACFACSNITLLAMWILFVIALH